MVRSRGSPRGGAKPSGPDGPSSWQPRVNQIRSAPLDAERRGWTRTFFDLKRQATPCGARAARASMLKWQPHARISMPVARGHEVPLLLAALCCAFFTETRHLDASNNYPQPCRTAIPAGRKTFLMSGSARCEHAVANYSSLVAACPT